MGCHFLLQGVLEHLAKWWEMCLFWTVAVGYPGRQTLRPGITLETHSQGDGFTGRDTEEETGQRGCGHEGPSSLCVLDLVL